MSKITKRLSRYPNSATSYATGSGRGVEDSPGNLRLIIQGYANKARGLERKVARVYVEIADTKVHDDSVNSPPREDVARSRQDTTAYGRD